MPKASRDWRETDSIQSCDMDKSDEVGGQRDCFCHSGEFDIQAFLRSKGYDVNNLLNSLDQS